MNNLYSQVCSYSNIYHAYERAREGKTLKSYVLNFEKNLQQNLQELQNELLFHTYQPQPLTTFILRDPKTRKISESAFRDRIVHHAIHNVIEPFFDKSFIYDSYANRKGKGTLKALERFDHFKRKVSHNNTKPCYVLKADIKHYFETVDRKILMNILKRKIDDERLLWLIKKILNNFSQKQGMPLGNLTSQFFANVYLNELDHFVKHQLKAKYYIRYVDDFVILHDSKIVLEEFKSKIDNFLKEKLKLELHPEKSKILILDHGINFLGFRVFYHHKLIRKKNIRKFERKLLSLKEEYRTVGGGGDREIMPSMSLKGGLPMFLMAAPTNTENS